VSESVQSKLTRKAMTQPKYIQNGGFDPILGDPEPPKDTQNEAKQRVLAVYPDAHEYFDGITYWVWKQRTTPKLCMAAGGTSAQAWQNAASKLTPTAIGPEKIECPKHGTMYGYCSECILDRPTAIPAQEPKCEWYGKNLGEHDWINIATAGWQRCAKCKNERETPAQEAKSEYLQTELSVYKRALHLLSLTGVDVNSAIEAALDLESAAPPEVKK
jgi:hypothetical protein